MARQSAGQEERGPFAAAASTLPQDAEGYGFAGLQRALNTRYVIHRIDRRDG